jgi:hypothetical protein
MTITKGQALELADKYLLFTNRIVLRDNISISKSPEGWKITADTTPMVPGMLKETIQFIIDKKTGKIKVTITEL